MRLFVVGHLYGSVAPKLVDGNKEKKCLDFLSFLACIL